MTGKDGEAGDIGVYRRYSRTQSSRKTSRSKPDRILRQAPSKPKTEFLSIRRRCEHEPVDQERGSRQLLMQDGEVIGMVLRTRTSVKPLYVSVGHRISLETAVDYVLRSAPRYRLPETTRQAHRLASG